METNPKIFLQCECSSEALEVMYEKEDAQFYVSLWRLGNYGHKMDLKERFRWCWEILKTGMPWADSVILNPNDIKQLADFLTENNKSNL
jgi:hypothetical protein